MGEKELKYFFKFTYSQTIVKDHLDLHFIFFIFLVYFCLISLKELVEYYTF